MKYFATVNGTGIELETDGQTVRIDGTAFDARLEDVPGTPLQLLTIDGRVHRVLIRRAGARGEYTVTVGGRRIAVEALNERARVIRELSGKAGARTGPAPLVAPMPGLVVHVNVAPGDQVRAGQGLVIMEAMKMENELRASAAGTIKAVHVTPGAAVEKGALLLEME